MSRPSSFKTTIDGRAAEIRVHEPNYVGGGGQTKLFKVVVFDADDRVLAVRNRKTVDLPGGRIEWEDDALADAVRREVLEAAGVGLGPLALAAVMVAMPLGESSLPPSNILAVTGRAISTGTPHPSLHIHRYAFLQKQKLLERYNAGNPATLCKLIEMAEFALREPAEPLVAIANS